MSAVSSDRVSTLKYCSTMRLPWGDDLSSLVHIATHRGQGGIRRPLTVTLLISALSCADENSVRLEENYEMVKSGSTLMVNGLCNAQLSSLYSRPTQRTSSHWVATPGYRLPQVPSLQHRLAPYIVMQSLWRHLGVHRVRSGARPG